MKYSCSICGTYFDTDDDNVKCSICGNDDQDYLLKAIEIENMNSKNVKEKLKKYISRKCHSAAYIKLCSKKLEDLGYFELARELDIVALKKLEYEAFILEILGVKDDIRLNLNNVISRAIEDLNLAKEISDLEHQENNEGIYSLLNKMKADEEKNIFILSTIAKKCQNEFQTIRNLE